ncbi:ABC transporter substrate-binding protein [Rhodoplanes sp. TEM]|uniref:ABC transporter substrate-binding protein n=1 Tax=Rhodoplanes tepidamans TaxID=200616 RepID=A0ABT5J612_RHOTP|nr:MULTISPECIES: ABC transporter substrate-binding protein [Rhodoplanes]MDC7785079.1 ABC transporter substrate-binding protein [Rhodoplanes tepidamans]MDC7982553.1 ABC transporter substrate-binding protein [Rhodoplanes sp. TEM]MDQ0356569.1 NitT/TauT family transport system substrate-binding protein [Rhodoplanes tepidamans]
MSSRSSWFPANRLLGRVVLLTAMALPGAASAAELKPWRHGVVEAKSDAGFVFMAAKGGFAEKQGIDLQMMQFKGDALALRAMLAGELDSYEGSPGAPLIAASRGADIKVVGCYWPGLTYALWAKKSVGGVADLKGKTLAISGPGALPDLFARAVLDKAGIAGNEVRFSVLGSDGDRFKAVTAGVVDAAAAATGFAPVADKLGVKMLVHAHDVVPEYIRFCTYVSGKTLAERGDDAARFLAASMASWRYALDNRDRMIAVTSEVTGVKADDPRAGYVHDEVVKLSAIDPAMPIPVEKLTWMRDLLTKTGNLTKPVDVKAMVDEKPRARALELVGK